MDQNNNRKTGMDLGNTQYFKVQPDQETGVKKILRVVFEALSEKGYDPVNQIVGYLLSGDPTYISSYNNCRYLISRMDRDELLEELLRYYVRQHGEKR